MVNNVCSSELILLLTKTDKQQPEPIYCPEFILIGGPSTISVKLASLALICPHYPAGQSFYVAEQASI